MYRVSDRGHPEAVVAFDEQFALENYERNGLEVEHPIRYGSWTGREDALLRQDVVLARKR